MGKNKKAQRLFRLKAVERSSPERGGARRWAVKRDVKRFYDGTARSYDDLYHEEQTGKYRWASEVRRSPWLGKILDVGCGTGLFSESIKDRGGEGCMVFGVDISLRLVQVARRRLRGQASFLICADADFLPFPGRTFDAAVAFTLLQNVPDAKVVLGEVRRVLRPGGALVVTYLKEKITLTGLERLLRQAGVGGEFLSCIVGNEHILVAEGGN